MKKLVLILSLLLVGCGRLDTPMPDQVEGGYTISEWHNGIILNEIRAKSVIIHYDHNIITAIGNYTIIRDK